MNIGVKHKIAAKKEDISLIGWLKPRGVILIVMLTFLTGGCKKDKDPNTSATTTSATTVSYKGSFKVERHKVIDSTSVSYYNANTATLYMYPWGLSTPPGIQQSIDSLLLNGKPMCYNLYGQDYFYTDTAGMSHLTPDTTTYPYTFIAISHSGFRAFTYTENGPYPGFTSATLPDTIFLSNGVTFNLGGVSNANEVSITVGTQSVNQSVSAPFPSAVNFTPAQLSSISPANHAYVDITASRTVAKKINSDSMYFQTVFVTRKYCVIR